MHRYLLLPFLLGIFSNNANALSPIEIHDHVQKLTHTLEEKVPEALFPTEETSWINAIQHVLQQKGQTIDRTQLLLAVDRNPNVQQIAIVLASPTQSWKVIGGTHVSTGKPNRREHFKTPIGVFLNTDAILGYRAQGTYNANRIRGFGIKGMRVWDFGWQTTEDWRRKGTTMSIRLAMHATDPDVLEKKLGRIDSAGCIRIPASFNKFLDNYGIIDRDIEIAARTQRRFAALLAPNRTPTPLAGNMVVVFDSSIPRS